MKKVKIEKNECRIEREKLMPGLPDQSKKIAESVKNGKLDEKVLDENRAGILNMILKSPSFKGDNG